MTSTENNIDNIHDNNNHGESTITPAPPAEEVPWHAAYPSPRNVAPPLSRQELLQWFHNDKLVVGKDFVLVDVRRVDFEGGTIHGSINLPAHSLYPTVPALYSILAETKVQEVVWYCGSSRGRGPRAAGWFADYLEEKGNTSLTSLVLEGGIKGWTAAGEEYTQLMDGYDEKVWRK